MIVFATLVDSEEERSKLEEIYIKYKKLMYYVANDILIDTHESEDVVQNSIIKVAKYIWKIDEVNSNKTKHLIVTIVKSTSIDVYRKRKDKYFMSLDGVSNKIESKEPPLDDIVIRLEESSFYTGHIPVGYKQSDTQSYGELRLIYYQNDKGDEIEFLQTELDPNFQVDTENATTTEINIHGSKGILVSKEEVKTLLWFTDANSFFIMGKLDEKEIVTMAESLEFIK